MSDLVTMEAKERLKGVVARQPYPLVFATISGAHLYGFPSPDSDYDLRGCHVLPVREVVGLDAGRETIETSAKDETSSSIWSRTTPRSSSGCCSRRTDTCWNRFSLRSSFTPRPRMRS